MRVNSIEQAIRGTGAVPGSLDDAGYRAAYAVAEDNLRLGRDVIGNSVNPWMLTRNAWRDTGLRAGAQVVEIEILCTDSEEHRHRVESRTSGVPGLIPSRLASGDRARLSPMGSRSPDRRYGRTQRPSLRGPYPRCVIGHLLCMRHISLPRIRWRSSASVLRFKPKMRLP